MGTKETSLPEIDFDVKVSKDDEKQIIIFNDDVNTFEHVIKSLIDVCEHTTLRAEQSAMMVHHNGRCSVKSGSYKKLEPRCTALLERGINAEIQ